MSSPHGPVGGGPARPYPTPYIDPKLYCTKCEGAGELEYSDVSSGRAKPNNVYFCMACNSTGIAPIPLCEADNGKV